MGWLDRFQIRPRYTIMGCPRCAAPATLTSTKLLQMWYSLWLTFWLRAFDLCDWCCRGFPNPSQIYMIMGCLWCATPEKSHISLCDLLWDSWCLSLFVLMDLFYLISTLFWCLCWVLVWFKVRPEYLIMGCPRHIYVTFHLIYIWLDNVEASILSGIQGIQ